MIRCILESLALSYQYVLNQLVNLTGHKIDQIHVVGGGSQNSLLCQMTADATNRPVIAGPVEATALGNAIVQLIALGELSSVSEGRQLIHDSFSQTTYLPGNHHDWESAKARFAQIAQQLW